ncbi:MAG TPA: histidine kinase dimerization/phospho-acceptor domain-containing protein, partial [Ktedonobacteraceae bacterium]|nr:histidine kinase dimerization/phospho-acceptor domain-containing protein [Ktedonobacteraceae bacterium]
MRFTVRSLGGKLIVSAALTLLLCLLLFSAASWYLLKSFYEHQAKSDAAAHLTLIEHDYQDQIASLIQEITKNEANDTKLEAALSQPLMASSRSLLIDILTPALTEYRLSGLGLIFKGGGSVLVPSNGGDSAPLETMNLVDQGKVVTSLQMVPGASSAHSAWNVEIVIPVQNSTGVQVGVLVATQRIDDYFASDLVRNTGLNVVLCESRHMLGTTVHNIAALDRHIAENALCAPGALNMIDGAAHYLTLSNFVQAQDQSMGSPALLVVDIEPLYSINAHTERALEILVGLGIFIVAFGVMAYALVARTFFIRPIRQLQARVTALVADNGDTELSASTIDELSMLARSFNLLSESLNTRENESNVITKQMSELLTMSDVLISTLNVEDLLGEIVSRLGQIMQVKSVALLLYGREMQSPWAVAQWSSQRQQFNGYAPAGSSTRQQGAVMVYTDPAGDIAMVVTTKMAAIPGMASRSVSPSSGKRSAMRMPKITSQTEQSSMPRPRIPRPALRDLDMILAHMAMQKQRIAYGEDVQKIYQDRGETWSHMALEAGYRSVIAVPLLLQEQAIGAVVLYGDKPYQVSRRDTFLLSTAAIQTAMAIQNALLFAEVKDKNAALERLDHLKSQFLATVTHELRTPLHSIISYGALLLEGFVEGGLTAEQEEHIQFMVRRAEDLSRLVDDMLDLSKIEADRLEVKVEPMALEPSLMEVVNQLKPMANNKGLRLTLEMGDALPLVLADGQRLRQVVINMVSNALKFTEKG